MNARHVHGPSSGFGPLGGASFGPRAGGRWRRHVLALPILLIFTGCSEGRARVASPGEIEEPVPEGEPCCGSSSPGGSEAGGQGRPASEEPEASASEDGAGAEYRGYEALDALVRTRLIEDQDLHLDAYLLPLPPIPEDLVRGSAEETAVLVARAEVLGERGELRVLLGGWTGTGLTNRFEHGKPNALSFLLWGHVFRGLAADLARVCRPSMSATSSASEPAGRRDGMGSTPLGRGTSEGEVPRLRPRARAAFERLCVWPSPSGRSDAAIEEVIEVVLGADAPEAERLALRQFFLGADHAAVAAEEVLFELLQALFLNPHFLLRK